MGNCLRTVYKETVNNDSLLKVDEVLVSFNDYSGSTSDEVNRITLKTRVDGTAYAIGSTLLYTDAARTQLANGDGKSMSLAAGAYTQYIRTGFEGGKIKISNKQGIYLFGANSNKACSININELDYTNLGNNQTAMSILALEGNLNAVGDVNDMLEDLSSIRNNGEYFTCRVANTNVSFGADKSKWNIITGFYVVFDGNNGCSCYTTYENEEYSGLFAIFNGSKWIYM